MGMLNNDLRKFLDVYIGNVQQKLANHPAVDEETRALIEEVARETADLLAAWSYRLDREHK